MKNTLTLLLIGISSICYSQSIKYTYDHAGNRLTRVYDDPNSTLVEPEKDEDIDIAKTDEEEINDNAVKQDILASNNVVEGTVYPNPTKGTVEVVLGGDHKLTDYQSLELVDLRGKIVYRHNVTAIRTSMDLGGCRKGIYYIHFKEKGLIKESWKIVKVE